MHLRLQLPEWVDEPGNSLLRPGRYKSIRGGRYSGKSHTFAQMAIARMEGAFSPWYPPGRVRIASARDHQTQIKQSVKTVVENYIKKLGLSHRFIVRSTWIDHVNGSHMFFPGVKNQAESFPSMEDIDIFWMEQAERLGDEMILIEPTIRKDGSELWFSWNPLERNTYCWQRFVEHPEPDDVNHWRNYDELPSEWLTAEQEKTRRWWEQHEPTLYRWMWLGFPNDADAELAILPYDLLLTCVNAYDQYAPDMTGRPVTHAGLDFAEGGRNRCAIVVRQGPNVEKVEDWPGITGDTDVCARVAKDHCEQFDVIRIYYDASAPLRSALRRVQFKGVRPFNFGGKVGGPDWFYEPNTLNKDIFARRNIQAAINLRLRANRTLRLVNGENVNPDDCLFINPRIDQREKTLGQFSQPKRRVNPISGKWEVLKSVGNEESPDRYDSLVMAFGIDTDGRGLRAR